MENTFISVLLCTYNDEKFIRKTIVSILEQTHENFEFLIINDGSTDNTLNIINEFDDPRIVLINKENSGLTSSLNLGVKLAKAKWIARIDGDDIAKNNRLEEQVKFLDDSVAVVGSQCQYIDEDDKVIAEVKLPLKHDDIIQKGTNFGTMFMHPSVIINKEKLLLAQGYDPLIDAAEDLDLWLKISTFGKLVNIDESLLYYRMHQNKISYLKRSVQILNATIAILKYHNKINRNITEAEYNKFKQKLNNDKVFTLLQKVSSLSIGKSGFLLKFYNLQFKILFAIFKRFSLK